MDREPTWDQPRARAAGASDGASALRPDLTEIIGDVHAGTARLAALGEKLGRLIAALDDAKRHMREYEATIATYEAELESRRADQETIRRLRTELEERDQAVAAVRSTLAQLDHRLVGS
jgi:uncharacterized protein YhaN